MAQTILSLAKTTRPTLAMVMPRERLFLSLDHNLSAARATWVAGPPGAGKTTLMASYLEARSLPALWYQLDSADSDAATFLYYLRQTALKHSKGASTPLPELAPAEGGDWAACARRLFRALFARFDRRLVLVFDNHEEIPHHSALHGILAIALEEAPPGRAICFLSRGLPPPPLARAQVNQVLRLLPPEALRLTEEECVTVAGMRGADLAAGELARIQAASAGWVAGAILLIEHARHPHSAGLADVAESVLHDYVAQEVFEQFDDHVKGLLLQVCWMRRLSLELAVAVTGDSRIRQVLVSLAHNNYFVTERDDNGEREYILHPLLRQFLQTKAAEGPGRRELGAQQIRCAEVLAKVGYIEEAVELLVANFDWQRLESIILAHAATLMDQARSELLRNWIEELPHDRVAASGWLSYWHGVAAQRYAPRASRRALEHALQLFSAQSDMPGVMYAACDLLGLVIGEVDDFHLMDTALDALRAALDSVRELQEDPAGMRALVMLTACTALREPTHADLSSWLQKLDRVQRKLTVQALPAGLRLVAALAGILSGDIARANAALALQPDDDDSELRCRHMLIANLRDLLHADPAAALVSWRDASNLAVAAAQPRLARLACIGVVAAGLIANRAADIVEEIDAVRHALAVDDTLSRCLGCYVLSWAALCRDDVIGAYHSQQQAVTSAVELGIPHLEVLCRTALAQLLFLCHDPRGGSSQLRRVHAIARDIRNPMLEHLTLLVYGDVAIGEKRLQSGINALRYAFGLGRQHGYFNIPWWKPQRFADLCVIAIEHEIEVEFVRNLIRRHGLRPQHAPVHLEQWPWALRIRTFGSFELSAANGTVAATSSGQGRPLQLLKLIAGSDGQAISAEAAATAMWPHVDSEYSMKSLTINLHRLRRHLGMEDVVLLRDGRLSLNAELVWTDVGALEQMAANIVAGRPVAGRPLDPKLADDALQKLFALYRGPWLAGEDTPGFDSIRLRLQRMFVETVRMLLDVRNSDDPSWAQTVLERALQCEPAGEGFYLRLMRLAVSSGHPQSAMDIHTRCRHALRTMGRTPGEEIEALRATLSD